LSLTTQSGSAYTQPEGTTVQYFISDGTLASYCTIVGNNISIDGSVNASANQYSLTIDATISGSGYETRTCSTQFSISVTHSKALDDADLKYST
jgi:hypothetical protein